MRYAASANSAMKWLRVQLRVSIYKSLLLLNLLKFVKHIKHGVVKMKFIYNVYCVIEIPKIHRV